MRLFVGDDWAEDHHDVEVMDEAGKVLARRRLPGMAGIAELPALAGGLLGEEGDGGEVLIGIETDHGPWVSAQAAAGYRVFPVNPLQSARFRQRHKVSGAKSEMPATRTCWQTWLTPTSTSCARRPATRRRRRNQGPGPHPQDDDLGANLGDPATAPSAAGVLPRRPGGLQRPGCPRHPRAAGQGTGPAAGPEADPRAGVRRDETGPGGAPSPSGPRRS